MVEARKVQAARLQLASEENNASDGDDTAQQLEHCIVSLCKPFQGASGYAGLPDSASDQGLTCQLLWWAALLWPVHFVAGLLALMSAA